MLINGLAADCRASIGAGHRGVDGGGRRLNRLPSGRGESFSLNQLDTGLELPPPVVLAIRNGPDFKFNRIHSASGPSSIVGMPGEDFPEFRKENAMTAEQDWQKFAALLADNDVESIKKMICEMSADQIKACMTHGSALLRVQAGEAQPITPGKAPS